MIISYQDICKNIFSEKEFIENSLLGIGILQDGRIIYANNTILENFGYSFDEIQEKDFWMKTIHPDDLSIVKRQIETKLKEKKYNTTRYKCRILLKSGDLKWIEVFSKNFYHNDRLAILFTIIEIPKPLPLIEISTNDLAKLSVVEQLLKGFNIPYRILKTVDLHKDIEQKLFEKKIKLKESEQKYHHLFETSPYSVVLMNFNGIIVQCNSATEKLFKYKTAELIGKNFFEFIVFPSESLIVLENAYKQLTKGQKLEPIEIQWFTKDERLVWLRCSCTLVRLHDEILIQVITQDITETKSVETK
ncbi:hypothetical protein ES703_120243 [subsurface metagenome]